MNRRDFIQSLMVGAAVVMLPSLGNAAPAPTLEWVPTTVDELTKWMEERFVCKMSEPRGFLEHRVEDLPKLYGFSAKDIPDFDQSADTARFVHNTVAYATEGDNQTFAEAQLVQALHKKFLDLDEGTQILWRVKPEFMFEQMTEYGDTWMTREQIEDRADLYEEVEVVRKGQMVKTIRKLPDVPLKVPEGVEEDINTGQLKFVKRRYTLNKVRMRLAIPLAPSRYMGSIMTAEGGLPKKV